MVTDGQCLSKSAPDCVCPDRQAWTVEQKSLRFIQFVVHILAMMMRSMVHVGIASVISIRL